MRQIFQTCLSAVCALSNYVAYRKSGLFHVHLISIHVIISMFTTTIRLRPLFPTRPFLLTPLFRSPGQRCATTNVTTSTTTTAAVHVHPRPLPPSERPLSHYIPLAIIGASVWGVALAFSMNYQKQGSSVVHGTMFTIRYDPRVQNLLGEEIDYANRWRWIHGSVNHLGGKVDIKFWVKGSKGEGEVHFASRRRGQEWETLNFSVRSGNGKEIVYLNDEALQLNEGAPFSEAAMI